MINEQFWDDQYRNNETPWDAGNITPPLKGYFDSITDKDLSILIPGCGNAYEAKYLLDKGFTHITLVEIAKTLVDDLSEKFAAEIAEGRIKILHQDFFDHQGKYDLIVEQTFFCALYPTLRPAYVEHMKDLLKQSGKLIGVLFNKEFASGPPYGGTKEEYLTLFDDYFHVIKMENCTNSIKPRMHNELFFEVELPE